MTAPFPPLPTAPAPAPLDDDPVYRRWGRQLWNRSNSAAARLFGKSEGLLARGADLAGWDSARDALRTQRAGWMEEANEYDEAAGPATTTGEKVAAFAGSVLPELGAYAVTGNVLGAGASGLSLGARILRGTAAALPVTAALEADAKETSTAYAVGKLLGSPQLERIASSRSHSPRVPAISPITARSRPTWSQPRGHESATNDIGRALPRRVAMHG